jgi:hypothetical protein
VLRDSRGAYFGPSRSVRESWNAKSIQGCSVAWRRSGGGKRGSKKPSRAQMAQMPHSFTDTVPDLENMFSSPPWYVCLARRLQARARGYAGGFA